MKFNYLAKAADGTITKGSIDAADQNTAADFIAKKSLTPISIKAEETNNVFSKIQEATTFVPLGEKVNFSKQLATLINAGIPIAQSMHILTDQTGNKKMKRAAVEIAADIEGGLSLSSALEKQKRIFSPLYSKMVKAGEAGGTLDAALEKMAMELEKEHELVAKIRGAMIYPTVILIAMVGVMIYMITSIIPQIAKIFTDMGGKLPASTSFLMSLSSVFNSYGLFIVIGIIAAIVALKNLLKRNLKARLIWHTLFTKIPVFGKIVIKINVVRFTRTLGSLLSSGVTVLEALKITSETIQNELFKKEILNVMEKVKNGSSIAEPLKTSKAFPVIVSHMVAVGEETGTLDKILLKVTGYYQKEVDNTVQNLSSLIEPMMMIFIGVGVGFIVISVISPIYQMSNLF